MAHTICTPEAGGELAYFQRLWRVLFASDIDSKTRIERLLEHEAIEFELDCAYLTHIDLERETERFEIAHGPHGKLQSGVTVPLPQTYCRKTITDPEGTVAISDAVAEGLEDDPAYETFGLGSYLGTTVSVDDKLYGTLCFSSTDARHEPIRDEEKALIEMHAQWVGYILDRWEGRLIRERAIDTMEKGAVSPEAIDLMMDMLRERTRRVVLMTLLGSTTEINVAALEQRVDNERAGQHLHHSALPKLDNARYIEWDDDSDTVSKGPKFHEVAPLVQLLEEYNTRCVE